MKSKKQTLCTVIVVCGRSFWWFSMLSDRIVLFSTSHIFFAYFAVVNNAKRKNYTSWVKRRAKNNKKIATIGNLSLHGLLFVAAWLCEMRKLSSQFNSIEMSIESIVCASSDECDWANKQIHNHALFVYG